MKLILILVCCFLLKLSAVETVKLGVDVFFEQGLIKHLEGKQIGIITNQTGVNARLETTYELLKKEAKLFKIKALFSPEHGIQGVSYAGEKVKSDQHADQIPIHSLHGNTRRPTDAMLKDIDVLIYDIQDIGVRAYTYSTTLYYAMEEAAKKKIKVIVLDRPNPINGLIVDGPMLDDKWRSFIGYINVPYCHGMTIGELAHFFNEEYKIGCELEVIPMKGWKRNMSFAETKLQWIPPSPHVPESDTPFYCATTGVLGEIEIANIGIGYTLPFKLVGADWIDADIFAEALNKQNLPGVSFKAFHYKPFYGSYKGKECHGVLIIVQNLEIYRPVMVQCAVMGILKSLYPDIIKQKLAKIDESKKKLFCQAIGSDQILKIIENERYATWKLIEHQKDQREKFLEKRKKYLRAEYEVNS